MLSHSRLTSLATIFLITWHYLGVRVLFKSLLVAPKSITEDHQSSQGAAFTLQYRVMLASVFQQGHPSKAYIQL